MDEHEAPKYQDWTPDDAAFASKELAMQQEHTRNSSGINVEQSTADRIGSVARHRQRKDRGGAWASLEPHTLARGLPWALREPVAACRRRTLRRLAA
jgi:hypothetical protein